MAAFKKQFSLVFLVYFIFFGKTVASTGNKIESEKTMNSKKVTILYDNYVFTEGTKSDWGFSCLVEGFEKTILFDTGAKSEILMGNIAKLGVDLKKVEVIVLSHNHWDHTGGLSEVLCYGTAVIVEPA